MRIENRFTLAVPVDVAWKALQDGERLARCVPGLVAGDGVLKVRVGAVATEYEGAVQAIEVDAAGRRLVARAAGTERNAPGEATATVTVRLSPSGSGTAVALTTDMTVTGRLGRYGSGVMGDLAAQLVARFAERLAADLVAHPVAPAPVATPQPAEGQSAQDEVAEEPVARPPGMLPARLLPAVAVGILAAMAVSDRRLTRWALGAAGAAAVTALAREARRATASP